MLACDPLRLPTFDQDTHGRSVVNVVIETPQNSRNKYDWDPERGLFKLGGVLAAGAVFPFDFGFVPSTVGDDGDPLDVLVLMDEPAFAGCLVPSRLIGVIEAEQTEGGQTQRNDRLLAVASNARDQAHVNTIDDLNQNLLHEIEHFFVSYNAAKDKRFVPLGRSGPDRAVALIQQARERFARESA
jgi:inorganic pyrophosphatase